MYCLTILDMSVQNTSEAISGFTLDYYVSPWIHVSTWIVVIFGFLRRRIAPGALVDEMPVIWTVDPSWFAMMFSGISSSDLLGLCIAFHQRSP